MRRYETIFIVRPNIAEDEIDAVINKTSSIIEGDGGIIIRIDKWGLKKLAYLIKKESQGYYVYLDYAGIPASVSEIERIFRIDDKVLKYLTIKLADSCDPEAIKEELASAEAAKTATEDEVKEDASPSETAGISAEDEAKEEEESPSEEKQAD
jgi:small subunit ribosomal protein S6